MKLVLFDCDGTLVDSVSLIHETMRRTFLHFRKPEPKVADTKAIIGLTLVLSANAFSRRLTGSSLW